MKKVLFGFVCAFFGMTQSASAEFTVNVRGTDYPIAALMDSCVEAKGGAEGQLKCFVALTNLVKEQTGAASVDLSVSDALSALRAAAEHQGADSGLTISGSDCRIKVRYYNNYYFVSRRNVSSIDLFEAEFDAAQMQLDQTQRAPGGAPSKGLMQLGASAVYKGGSALESAENNFPTKTAQMSVGDYANTVAGSLATRADQSFDFVLVHPAREPASADIWKAFDTFVRACQA